MDKKRPADPIHLNKNFTASSTVAVSNEFRGKRALSIALTILFLTSIFSFGLLRFLQNMYETLPEPGQLSNIEPSLVTKVLASDSTVIHEFSIEKRYWVPGDEIPDNLKHALISIEDRRFYDHWGIDLKRIFGAAFVDLVRGGYAQGASTLTQQLARNVYLSSKQTIIRKIREIMTSVQLETYYTKDEILEMYLNMVYLGGGVYGVETASLKYFGKHVKDLDLNECATLAGCIQLPEYYRPDKIKNHKRTTKRRRAVLSGMVAMDYISKNLADSVSALPVPNNPTEKIGNRAPYFVEMVRKYMEKEYGEKELYNGGLTILTTLDPIAQDSAQHTVDTYLDTIQRRTNAIFLDSNKVYKKIHVSRAFFLDHFDSLYALNEDEYKAYPDSMKLRKVQTSATALDVHTGAIKVLIGGRDFYKSKFNRAVQSWRQAGSSFKPFVYTTAINKGYTPASVIMDQPITLETSEGLWRPENYEKEFYGPTTLRDALRRSINLVAIQILMDVGVNEVIATARKFGMSGRLPSVPALAIGACQVSNIEMASAYSVFANGGKREEPYYIEAVYDKHGRVLETHERKEYDVITPQTAYVMASLMSSVVRAGTGAGVIKRGFTRPAAGKTGTTNDYTDAWFVGYTPFISCAVWTGVDERRSMGRGVTGAKGSIPVWVSTMKALHRDLPRADFHKPDGIVTVKICSQSHKIATKYCPDSYDEIMLSSNLPDTCRVHLPGSGRKTGSLFGTVNSSVKKTKKSGGLIF